MLLKLITRSFNAYFEQDPNHDVVLGFDPQREWEGLLLYLKPHLPLLVFDGSQLHLRHQLVSRSPGQRFVVYLRPLLPALAAASLGKGRAFWTGIVNLETVNFRPDRSSKRVYAPDAVKSCSTPRMWSSTFELTRPSSGIVPVLVVIRIVPEAEVALSRRQQIVKCVGGLWDDYDGDVLTSRNGDVQFYTSLFHDLDVVLECGLRRNLGFHRSPTPF
jgi:hypothetical protein